jgi:hypothetical protein
LGEVGVSVREAGGVREGKRDEEEVIKVVGGLLEPLLSCSVWCQQISSVSCLSPLTTGIVQESRRLSVSVMLH